MRLSDGGKQRISGAKSEVEVITSIATRLFDDSTIAWSKMHDYQNIRELIAQTIPGLEEIKNIGQRKLEFQVPGRMLHRQRYDVLSESNFLISRKVDVKSRTPSFKSTQIRILT